MEDVEIIGDANTIFPAVDNRTARDMTFGIAVAGEDVGDPPLERG